MSPKPKLQHGPFPADCESILDSHYPDPREDLESRSPNLGPYTTKGTLKEPPLRDLLFGSSRGSGYASGSVLRCNQREGAPRLCQDQRKTLQPSEADPGDTVDGQNPA